MEHLTLSQHHPSDSRDDYRGSRHHVMARGGSRRDIFDGPQARAGFLALLGELEPRFGVHVHAYALMGNHYHLLLSSHRGKLSDAMQYVNGSHARRFNHRVQQDGPLFRGRFVSRAVEDERYWVYLLAYVHLNPFKDGFVRDVSVLPWTSHQRYLGRAAAGFVRAHEHLALLHGVEGYRYLIEGVSSREIDEPEGFEGALARFPTPMSARQGGDGSVLDFRLALDALPPDIGDLKRVAGARTSNTLRWVTWWLDQNARLQRAELARQLGVAKSTVTRRILAVERGAAGARPDWLPTPSEVEERRSA